MEWPLTFQNGLTQFTKDELHQIRKRHHIKNASQLNKAELIEVIQQYLLEHIKEIVSHMDQNQFSLVKNIVQNNGFITHPHLDIEQISYLQTLGIIFPGIHNGQQILAVPTELITPLQTLVNDSSIFSQVKRNTEWILLTQGMLYYYGFMRCEKLMEKVEEYTGQTVNRFDYIHVIHNAGEYYQEYKIDFNFDGFAHNRVEDIEKILVEQNKRADIEHYPFSKQQLLKAGVPNFVEQTKEAKALQQFLLKYFDVPKDVAEEIVEDCIFSIQEGVDFPIILENLQRQLQFADFTTLQKCIDLVIKLANNTREWYLKGHTASEIFGQEKQHLRPLPKSVNNPKTVVNKRKVGRNEPCPCGSGKKHKRCCGK